MAEEIRVPNLGESVSEAIVAKWLKAEGEAVAADEPVAELETDKVAVEVTAPVAGVLAEHKVAEGDTVEVGAVIALVDPEGKAKPTKKPAPAKEKAAAQKEAPAPESAPPAAADLVDIVVPSAGESVTEATLAQWHKKVGEAVAEDETVAELETDKAALEINAPAAGVLAERLVEEGGTVHPGDVIGRIARRGTTASAAPRAKAATAAAVAAPAEEELPSAPQPLAPAVRRLIAEYDLDPASIPGSGKEGRITKADVLAAIESGLARRRSGPATAAAATIAAEEAAPREERVPMTRLRKRIAERLKEAQNTAAMLTTFNDVDMSAVIAARQRHREVFERKHGIKLGFMSFFVKAAVLALREVPQVNARIEDDEIVYQNFYDIGVAVSAPQGLVVPVVRDADRLSFADTEKA
ncbi:MAG: biotin/lipoyl-containing protein, partial [Rhodothalassiaceae bacterium]